MGETCAVEVSVLQGVQNELTLVTTILALAYQHGGLLTGARSLTGSRVPSVGVL